MRKLRFFIFILAILSLAVLHIACQPKMKAEEDCNFVMSSQLQRVSWKANLPVTLYIHRDVPAEYRNSIRVAATQWNYRLNKYFFQIWDDSGNLPSAPVKDGLNVIYWQTSWEGDLEREQGRTTIFWRGDQITEADILINAKNHTFSTPENPGSGDVDFVSLMVHELGHALGLQHIQGVESVMNPTLANNVLRVNPLDVDLNSLNCEYKL